MFEKRVGGKGFTLVEALIAVAIFAMVAPLAGSGYVYSSSNYKYIKVKKELIDDSQFVLERISRELQDSTIDYEEYYNRRVLSQKAGYTTAYGNNYGVYASQFIDEFGVNTGQNPPLGLGSTDENDWWTAAATCDGKFGIGCQSGDPWDFTELYLINGNGDEKTIFKKNDSEDGLQVMKMYFNEGVFEGDDFYELSPPRTKIKTLKFFVSPTEDPRKAFAEKDLSVQLQPHVTILLKVGPADNNISGLNKEALPSLTIQATLSSRVYHEVK